MAVTTVIFDLGGVLVSTKWERVTHPFAEMSGQTPDRIMEGIRTGEAYFPFMRGEFDADEFYRRITRQFGLRMEKEALFETWSSIIEPMDDVVGLVDRLKGRYRLAIGSNTDVLHYARGMEVQPVLGQFDDVLVSYELGYCKPDAEFFQRGLEKLSASPEECVFIDDRQDNVDAANSMGIAGLQFTSAERLESDLANLGIL